MAKIWTPADTAMLRHLVAQNTPTRIIAWKMGRTVAEIYEKASQLGISLKPVNQSPYGTMK